VNIDLSEKDFSITAKFKQDLGDISLRMSILKVEGDMRVVEFTKTDGNLMNYYTKVKDIKGGYLEPLQEHYKEGKKEEEEKKEEEK